MSDIIEKIHTGFEFQINKLRAELEAARKARNSTEDYAIALGRAIEHATKGMEIPPEIAAKCPHHAQKLEAARQREAQLAAALHFIRDECDWELHDIGGGDERIGPACTKALEANGTALATLLLAPTVSLLEIWEADEHMRNGASHLWKLIDTELTRLRSLCEPGEKGETK